MAQTTHKAWSSFCFWETRCVWMWMSAHTYDMAGIGLHSPLKEGQWWRGRQGSLEGTYSFHHKCLCYLHFLLLFKHSCPHIPTCPSAPPIPAFHPQTYSLWFCPCVFYTHSLMALLLFSPITSLLPLSGYCQFLLYFNVSHIFCLLVLLIRSHLEVRAYGICLSLPGLFHLA